MNVTFNIMAAPGTPFYAANASNPSFPNFFQPAGMNIWSPGIFTENGLGNGVPAGHHLNFSTMTYPLFLSSPKIKDVMLEFMKGQPVSTTRLTLPPLKFAPLSNAAKN